MAADVSSYDSYNEPGWIFEFGTSVSTPLVAGIYGLAKNPASSTIPASAPYGAASKYFHDITKGEEGTCVPAYFCQALKGYDGPTGLGTPDGVGGFKVPATPPATIASVSFAGSPSNPTVTVTGSNLDPIPPVGSPENCQTGDTGDDFGSTGLSFADSTQGWGAGQAGDCIGLILSSWSSSQIVFSFGNEYANYPEIQVGDAISLQAQGIAFNGLLG